jgi:hypothetical protein
VAYARIVLELGRPMASWFTRAYLAIDGQVHETRWGRSEHIVPAGSHLLEVWHRSWFGKDLHRAVLTVDVAENTEVRLAHSPAYVRWQRSVLSQVGDPIAASVSPSLPKATAREVT